MKIADNQTLPVGSHFELVDTWRQEWEKGVQVRITNYCIPIVVYLFSVLVNLGIFGLNLFCITIFLIVIC